MMAGVSLYLAALLVALLGTPVTARIARAAGAIDMPGARKVHRAPVPRIGGLVFIVVAFAVATPIIAYSPSLQRALAPIQKPVATMLVASGVVFLLGLMDDLWDISAKLKFVGLVGAALAVCSTGARIESLSLGGGWSISTGMFAWSITVLWIVGVTVSMNFIDGLDGLAAGVAAIACGAILVVSIWTGQTVMAALMLALLGALTGFLMYNFNPAGIFMGDCGSMFLGFIIASSAIVVSSASGSFAALALPALALGAPLVDTLLTFIRRGVLERRSIFRAERGHIHHRLVDLGLSQRQAVLLLYAITIAAVGLGSFMMVTHGINTVLVFANVVLLLLLIFRGVGSLRLRTMVAAVQRNHHIHQRHGLKRRNFEDVQLMLRVAARFDAWWDDLCEAARRMDFARMTMRVVNRDGATRTLRWRGRRRPESAEMLLTVAIPVRQRRRGGPLRIEVDLVGDGSLESAGESLVYFSRLLDEHSVADLPNPVNRGNADPTIAGEDTSATVDHDDSAGENDRS